MDQRYRPILPSTGHSSASRGTPQLSQPNLKKRRSETKVACNNCRAKKLACSGDKPSCSRCFRGDTICIYTSKDERGMLLAAKSREIEEARNLIQEYEGIIGHLQSVSEPEALASLRRLRSALDVTALFTEAQKEQRAASPQVPYQSVESPLPPLTTIGAPTVRGGDAALDLSEVESDEEHHRQGKGIDPSLLTLAKRETQVSDITSTILERLRSNSNPQSILGFLRGDIRLNNQPGELNTALSMTPPVQSPHQLQLMMQHPVSYPRLDPELFKQSRGIPSELLTTSTNRVASSANPLSEPDGVQTVDSYSSAQHNESSGSIQPHDYIDLRLAYLDIGFWTTVPVDNSFAAEIISMYLRTDHPVMGLFEPGAFLDGLVQNDISVCSSFEVNALLACASRAYSANSSSAVSFSHQFEAEANKLWRGECTTDSLASVVGLSYLFLLNGSHGRGDLAQARLQDMADMAKRMKLFGTPDSKTADDISALPLIVQKATAYAAWGAFNLVSMQSLFWAIRFEKYPPRLPIPGQGTSLEGEPEIPGLTDIQMSSWMGDTFAACCQFWNIVAEVLAVYHVERTGIKAPLAFALSKYQKILNWADSLPATMARNNVTPGHVLVFHIWLHAVILHIFQPFISHDNQHDFSRWNASSSIPEAIFSASVKQLKHLILAYRHSHMAAPKSMLWNVALIYVANSVLKNATDPERSFYFMLCIYSYRDIAPSFPIAEGIAQGLLAIAVKNGVVSSRQAVSLMDQFKIQDLRRTGEKPRGRFVLDLNLAVQDNEAAQIDVLVDKFDEMMFSEWTNEVV